MGCSIYELQRDFEIAVIGARGLGNGWVLPSGPLREPPSRLNDVDALVLNATEDVISSTTPRYVATSGFTNAIQYATGEVISLDTLSKIQRKKQYSAAAVAGIAVPKKILLHAQSSRFGSGRHSLPDHYDYDKKSL